MALGVGLAANAAAWVDLGRYRPDLIAGPDKVHVLDGSYVMNVGELQVHITNYGLIGSQYSSPSSYADAPSAQWPAGTGNEYLWAAGLWIGGLVRGERRVSTGQYEAELRPLPEVEETLYEARNGTIVRPAGHPGQRGLRLPHPEPDDDRDGRMDEEALNGHDDDGDGLIDEDFGQIGQQLMVCTMYDNTPLSRELYPDHQPLDLKIVQRCFAWEGEQVSNFVGFDYEITNIGPTAIEDLYVGMFVDCDIGPRSRGDTAFDDMAGTYRGMVRAFDGAYYNVSVAYMYDGAAVDPLTGYFGIFFLGSPMTGGRPIRSFQRFSGQRPYIYGGDPEDDAGRYEVLSARSHDPNTEPGDENDHRFLASVGPWSALAPNRTITLHLALVIGEGLEGMLQACADALAIWSGAFFDLDDNRWTGWRGRETYLCYQGYPPSWDPIWEQDADYMNLSCATAATPIRKITVDDFEIHRDGRRCIWVNYDNCQECDRRAGQRCTWENSLFDIYWNCNKWLLPPEQRIGCTGIAGAESRVPWILMRLPPTEPGLRVVPHDNATLLFWDDRSEHALDLELRMPDFESYRIWRADNWDRPEGTSLENGPPSDLWQMLAEFDLDNDYVFDRELGPGVIIPDTLPLGQNTGLEEIAYRPVCLDDPRFRGLAEVRPASVAGDGGGRYETLPPLRDAYGVPVPDLVELLPWERYPAVLDTFFQVTPRVGDSASGIEPKRSVRFYRYVDRDVHNGFLYFYSVTASDHRIAFLDGQPRIVGDGLSGSPQSSFTHSVPGTRAQSPEERDRFGPNIFVYPNPVSLDALADFQQFHPNEEDPTGQRLMFANLPLAQNEIQIYTLDGDLVHVIRHDGTSGHGEVSWNLVSRNGQQIVSGIYLYVVRANDGRFADFIGKFVVIR